MKIRCFVSRMSVLVCLCGMTLPLAASSYGRVGQCFSFVGKRKELKGDGWTSAVVFSAYDTEGWASLLEETWSPRYVPNPRFHKIHSTSFYIISGSVEWTVQGQVQVLGKDDCVFIPPFASYEFKVLGDQNAKVLRLYQPGGYEIVQEYLQTLTPEQQQNPSFVDILAKATDTYITYSAKGPKSDRQEEAETKYFNLKKDRKYFEYDVKSGDAISSVDSGGRMNLQEEFWTPTFVVGNHFHNTKTETFYVLDNRIEWTVGGEKQILNPGDAVHIPANVPHSVKALDGKGIHNLMFYQPYGYDLGLQVKGMMTPEQKKDPHYQKLLKTITDFTPVN